MKICIILLTICLFTEVTAQQRISGITLKTTKKGEKSNAPEPSPESERFKMNCLINKDTGTYILYLREYVNGRKRHDNLEQLISGRGQKGTKVFWEVVPDTSAANILRVFVYTPGFIAHRMKVFEKGKYFSYAPYRLFDLSAQAEEVPLMLFYEDDTETREVEKRVEKHLTDGKLNPDIGKNNSLLSGIKRYVILTYTQN
jgi:hypothetical protein